MDYAKAIEDWLFCKICDRWYCSRYTRFDFPDREVEICTLCSILRPNNEINSPKHDTFVINMFILLFN